MISEAIAVTAMDLFVGLGLALTAAFVIWAILHEERHVGREQVRAKSKTDDEWNFPPRWKARRAETHLGKQRVGIDREAA